MRRVEVAVREKGSPTTKLLTTSGYVLESGKVALEGVERGPSLERSTHGRISRQGETY
jgi:hypothetical protein